MTRSYLSKYDFRDTINELRLSKANKLIESNKAIKAEYRQEGELSKFIYDLTWAVLQQTLGPENIFLPIDVRQVANALGFSVSSDDFSDVELDYILRDNDCLPIAQLKMRQKLFGKERESICGTIRVAEYLSENSTRFSIAHELGHFVLRHQNPIGSSVVLEACPGLYPLVDTEEMLADMFAQALLLPYELFLKEREEYEKDRTHWPLDYSRWVSYIRDKAQIPEYHAVIACQEIKKRSIIGHMEAAEESFKNWVLSITNSDSMPEKIYLAIKTIYANTVFNLEGWGFSSDQVADILFRDWTAFKGTEDSRLKRDIVFILHDYRIRTEIEQEGRMALTGNEFQKLLPSIPECFFAALFNVLFDAGLSESGITRITEITNVSDYLESTEEFLEDQATDQDQ
jgi:hypothetical protein